MEVRGGNRIKWGQRTKSSPRPCMVFFVLPHSCLTCMTEKIFLPYPCPLGPCEAPTHPVKLYFLLIFLTTITIFLIKYVSLMKIYLTLQLNLSYQIKLFFCKSWIKLFKCLTRQYHRKNLIKKKNTEIEPESHVR